jgi:hypothetical protein
MFSLFAGGNEQFCVTALLKETKPTKEKYSFHRGKYKAP